MSFLSRVKIVAGSEQKTLTVYHGSDKTNIKAFEKGHKSYRYLLFKSFPVDSQGVFFAFDPEIAKGFGDHIYEVEIDRPKLFIDFSDKHAGVDRLDPKREKELANMLLTVAVKYKGHNVIHLYETDVYIPDDFDLSEEQKGPQPEDNWAWVYEAIGAGVVWDLLDEPKFVKKMKSYGYDGTLAEESTEQGGQSLFISNLDKIKSVTPYEEEPYEN